LLIDGALTESASGEQMAIVNPVTGEMLDSVPRGGRDEVARAVAATRPHAPLGNMGQVSNAWNAAAV
jgi:acyl-CoA reductase-like NAD-dependent aldehyde dehydrogenase